MKITMTRIPTLILLNSLRISIKEGVTKTEVSDFKNKWCNENQIITNIIKNGLVHYFNEPILDVGAGLGDIAFNALYNKEVICIDVNKFTEQDYPLSKNHQRFQIDFFDYVPDEKINTVFISHTLQFLDEELKILNERIKAIDPENIILILNKNNDFLGKLLEWSEQNFVNSNPEVSIPNFPDGYEIREVVDFKATLKCESYNDLATQISYLMLIDLDENIKSNLVEYLKLILDSPGFEFNQQIKIYSKNGKK